MIEAINIHVKGVVQGVGFRPFVYRLAKRYLVNGWVLNAADGVFIHAEAEAKLLDEFVMEISENPPSASQVDEIEIHEVPLEGFSSFEIRFSDEATVEKTTLISPDLAACDDCVRELFDEENRRYRYPFINCTNCGPRFTIIDGLPYDRKSTSMRDFPLCLQCQSEYDDPLDRRFHAQPNACFACGPHLSWRETQSEAHGAAEGEAQREAREASFPIEWGDTQEKSDAIIERALKFLRAGKILAVKGLGGFHLVCDGENPNALQELRARKRRKGQAFAVMMDSLAMVHQFCAVNEVEEKTLAEPQRPIVLLKKREGAQFAPGLADGLPELGVMLPYTPIQHLLARDFGGMLVMTSGNIHDEPIVTDDEEAYQHLGQVADAILGHNRAILSRYDDSVVRVLALGKDTSGQDSFALQFIRRARGYAPMPLALPDAAHSESLFATGPEQKNTFCMTRGAEAFVSQHIGDMENAETFDAWLAAKKRYEALFEINPERLACDLHPEYLTSKWVHEQKGFVADVAAVEPVGSEVVVAENRIISVQHHHAHIVSVMAEHDLKEPTIGIAFDGTGYGVDKKIWGGEVLICNMSTFERFANFSYVPMPGGAAAIKHPLRMAYGVLWAFDLLEHEGALSIVSRLGAQATLCSQMIEKTLNTPFTSSVGRLFDAASAILDICTEPRYEGEGAILLEAAIGTRTGDDAYGIDLLKNAATKESTALDTSVLLLDGAPLFKSLLDDVVAGIPVATIALRFHNAFVQAIVDVSRMASMAYGLETVALSGGVFMNRYLTETCVSHLVREGFTVAINRELPPNDGCISYGQAVIASAK
ncbi:MAG: carbamoyltransferase HypF [Eggerthellaceae bacterium]|nr:carbamoyltransferase HypF [Eggerthellaceae bacterium]